MHYHFLTSRLAALALLLAAPLAVSAQVFYSNGATVFVNTGGSLNINGAAQQAGAATLRTAGTTTVAGNFSSAATATLDLATGTLTASGNLTNAGTTTATTGTLRLSGTTNQTLDLNGGTVGQLVVNKTTVGGTRVDVPSSVTALTGVALTAGLVRTASTATLVLPAGATLTGEGPGQYVQGNVQVSRPVAGTAPVDFGNGAVIVAGGNNLGTVAVTRTAGLQQAGTSYATAPGGSPTNSIDRIWAINPQSQPAAGTSATLTLSWLADDDGGLNTPALRASAQAFRQPPGSPAFAAVGVAQDASTRSLSVAVTAFSNWTVSAATTPLATRNTASQADLRVYPNPARSYLLVQRPAEAGSTAELRDALGRVVRTLTLPTPETRVSLEGLATGVYLLRLPDAGLTQRVVVE